MCPAAVASIRLERALALHAPETLFSDAVELLMLANAFRECQREEDCVRVAVLRQFAAVPNRRMDVWSLPKVFHTCGKNCGNSGVSSFSGEKPNKMDVFRLAKVRRIVWFC